MPLQHTVYLIAIQGPGRGYHEAYAALERSTHLSLGAHYLVLGDEARNSILAHDREGDAHITARPAHSADVPDADALDADTVDIERFVERIGGTEFQWNETALTWSLPGYQPTGSQAAGSRREGALAALATVLATQNH